MKEKKRKVNVKRSNRNKKYTDDGKWKDRMKLKEADRKEIQVTEKEFWKRKQCRYIMVNIIVFFFKKKRKEAKCLWEQNQELHENVGKREGNYINRKRASDSPKKKKT